MKKSLGLALAGLSMLLSSSQLSAQWVSKNSGTIQDLTSIRFINANTGFACGAYNTLIKTTDGGASWQTIGNSSIPPASYLSIDALSSNNIFVARNGLFVTEDGGASWKEWGLLNNSAYSIQSIKAINDSTAFITKGGYILKTTNKGVFWSAMYFNNDLNGPMQFTGNNDTAYAASGRTHDGVSYGTIHKSTDGGANWTDLNMTSPQITAMYFRTSRIGYYAAFGNWLYRTSDGGVSWQAFHSPVSALNDYITGIFFSNDQTGYVITMNGFIYKTSDGGAGWKAEYTGHMTNGSYDVPLSAIAAVGNNKVLVVGNAGTILMNDGPLSIPAPEKFVIRTYPNPVTNDLTIELGQTAQYQRINIYDALGRSLYSKAVSGQQKVVLSMVPFGSGSYMLVLKGLGTQYSTQVIVQ